MADEKQGEKMVKVRVRVPDRSNQGFPGFWSAGQFFPNGDSEAVIPESRLEELKAESLLVVTGSEPASGDAKAPEAVQAPAAAPSSDADRHSPAKPLRK